MVSLQDIEIHTNSLAIIGWEEGGAGQVQAWLESYGLYHVACFVNPSDEKIVVDVEADRKKRDTRFFDYPEHDTYKGKPLITSSQWIDMIRDHGITQCLVLLGDKELRHQWIRECQKREIALIRAIHPSALVMEDAVIHENVVLHARSIVGYRAEIFPGVILNTNAQVDHHNVLRTCCQLDPGAKTAGNVTIGEYAHVHTGATIINKIRIGKRSIIGAGSVIIRDVPDDVTVVGVPGTIIKKRNPES